MHTRQSGAAHVPIMFFILLLVMFLGAVGVAYIVTDRNANLSDENRQLREDIKALQGQNLLFEHYIADIGEVFKMPGPYSGRDTASDEAYGASEEFNLPRQTMDGVSGVMNPDAVRQRINEFGTALKLDRQ